VIGTIDETEERDAVLRMRMDALLTSSPASFLSILGAAFAVYVYWAPATIVPLFIWLGCIVAIALINLISTLLYARNLPAHWTAHSWARFVTIMHLLSGLSWGVGGAWMLTLADQNQALLTLSIGLAAVTVSIPSVIHMRAYNLFHLPIFWSYSVGLVFSSLQFNWLIAVGMFMLGAFAVVIGRGLGDQLSRALHLSIENKRLAMRLEERGAALEAVNRELEIESQTDPLTGVANRRRLMSVARSLQGPCAILIVDVDHFKSYNDSFGHVAGDACLVAVAQALAACIRPEVDLVARLGGEEFAVLLAGVANAGARERAEQIRAAVQALHTTNAASVRRQVTVSIGLSARDGAARKPLATLIEEADAAVYRAKAAGRNQVCGGEVAPSRSVA